MWTEAEVQAKFGNIFCDDIKRRTRNITHKKIYQIITHFNMRNYYWNWNHWENKILGTHMKVTKVIKTEALLKLAP
jgi:hypothetical protein